MNNLDLPPFPRLGEKGPQVCERVRFYLAIVDDLPFEQVRILSEHVKSCEKCSVEFQLLQRATRMVAALPASAPSARVDAAIMAALQNRQKSAGKSTQLHSPKQVPETPRPLVPPKRVAPRRRALTWTLAAALVVLLLTGGFFLRGMIFPAAQAFQLPSHLSWNGYVMHYTQTRVDAQGHSYQVEVYQDLGSNNMHIESTMPGKFDVVVVTDSSDMLGEDMMHHVAQEGNGVANWAVDGSLFNLAGLRQDLADGHATYLGKGTYQGQAVYQIRVSGGQVLLLNMQYLPVNALSGANGSGASIYQTCALLLSAKVSDSMWDMHVQPGFQMGTLPASS